MRRRTGTRASRAVDAMMARKVDLARLDAPGTVDDMYHKLARELAHAYHVAESDDIAISWPAQERAQSFFNAHGFEATLDELFRVRALARPTARA